MNEWRDVQKLVPFLQEDQCQEYINENNIHIPNSSFLDHCVVIFLTQCKKYQRIERIAKSLNAFLKTHPFPIIFYHDTSIIIIYQKLIFDASNKSPIEATE